MSTPSPDTRILEIAQAVIRRESSAIATLPEQLGPSIIASVQTMLACKGHILVAGVGTSNPVAARFAHLLSCCGTPALFIHPGDSQHGLSGAVTERDVLFAISKGGETVEVNNLVRVAQARGAKIIALTEKPESALARMSHIVLRVQAPPDSDPYGMIATGSSLFNAALCDAICEILLDLRGYTKERFGETHPGGAVGIKLAEENQLKGN